MSGGDDVRLIPVCPKCGSDNVVADATARWSSKQQQWKVSSVFEKGGCDECGVEDIEFSWIECSKAEEPSREFAARAEMSERR